MCLYTGVRGCCLVKHQTAITSGFFFLPEITRECMPAERWCCLEAEEGYIGVSPTVSSCFCEL